MYHLEKKYGVKGPVRVTTNKRKDLKFLLIEADGFNIAIRPKKCNEEWRSRNHRSGQQDVIRSTGKMPSPMLFEDSRTFNLVLGWRDSGGLEPALSHIAIVWERRVKAEIIARLWTVIEGTRPITEIQPDLSEAPPQPKIEPKRKDAAGDGESKTG